MMSLSRRIGQGCVWRGTETKSAAVPGVVIVSATPKKRALHRLQCPVASVAKAIDDQLVSLRNAAHVVVWLHEDEPH
jgi:hypothetical protein